LFKFAVLTCKRI